MSTPGIATVGVMGSGTEEHEALTVPLGRLLAGLEVNLLTGAGPGVMTAVARAYLEARRGRGLSLGIVPCKSRAARQVPRAGYPNPYVEVAIYTHLPLSGEDGGHELSRNHINVLSSDIVIAIPGGAGTASEVRLALEYDKPVAGFAFAWHQLEGFDARLTSCFEIDSVEAFLRRHLKKS